MPVRRDIRATEWTRFRGNRCAFDLGRGVMLSLRNTSGRARYLRNLVACDHRLLYFESTWHYSALWVIMFYAKEGGSLPWQPWKGSSQRSAPALSTIARNGCSRVTIYQSYNVSIARCIARMFVRCKKLQKALLYYTDAQDIRATYICYKPQASFKKDLTFHR